MEQDLESLKQELAQERQRRLDVERQWDAANRRMDRAFQALRAGSFSWHRASNTVDWNQSFSMLHGFDHANITPNSEDLLAAIPADYHEYIIGHVETAMKDGKTFDVTYPVRWADGSEHWILTRGSWDLDDAGEPRTLFGFAMDADARIAFERQLAESEKRLQDAQAAGGVGVWDFDIINQSAHVSDEYLRMHGFADASYSLAHYRKYVPEEDLVLQTEAMRRASTPGTEYDVEHRIIHAKTGEIRWVHGRGTAEFDESGKMVRIMGTTQDITERKLAEIRYRDSTRIFHTLTQASPTLIFRFDEDGQITLVNEDRWIEFSGREAGGWQDGGWFDAFHPEDRERAAQEWIDAASNRTPYEGEFRWQHVSGEVRWLLLHALPVYGDNGFNGFVGTGMNITALKESEQERFALRMALADTQKMEAIGTLASGVAHDFNNLLAGVRGFIELASMDVEESSETADYLQQAQAAIDQARNVTEGLLTFARRNPTNKKVFALNTLISDNMDLLRKLVPASIAIETVLCPEQVLVCADETQIRQTLVNLVINARDAMPDGGQLKVSLSISGAQAMVNVDDNGQGMDEKTQARIFEPFFTTKPHGQGTGLGLSIAHGIMQAHEGSVHVESQPGSGTRITLALPRTEDELPSEPLAAKDTDGQGQGQRILVVEDNDLVRESYVLRIRSGGYSAHGVGDGETALARLSAAQAGGEAFDAVVLDVDLPGDNGVALAQRMRSTQPGLPAIYITGNVLNKALAANDEEPVLAKPINFADLFKILVTTLGPVDSLSRSTPDG